MKIIANLICLDSEPELPTLLKSLEGRVDAVVAIDGGSQDKTVELLSSWGQSTGIPVHVLCFPWPDDFAEQRNRALDLTRSIYGASTDAAPIWILMIDTDDELVEFDRAFIEKSCLPEKRLTGLQCKMDNGNGFFFVTQFFTLTRNAIWEGPIHEAISVPGVKGLPPDGVLTIKRGRSARHDLDPERNVRIGRRAVEAAPQDTRQRFYLARDLMECDALPEWQRKAEAEGHLRIYLFALKSNYPAQDRYALLLLVNLLVETGRLNEARELLLKSIAEDPENRSAFEALGRLTAGKSGEAWSRLAAAASGNCVLPYGSQLPKQVG